MHWYSKLFHCYIVYLYRKKQAEWSRNYTLEKLIAKNSWTTIDEMESERYCDRPSEVCLQDLMFATRFINNIFICKGKMYTSNELPISCNCNVGESEQYNRGCIDQAEFKTNGTYTLTLLL